MGLSYRATIEKLRQYGQSVIEFHVNIDDK
jgi:hypothetical protein